MSWRAEIPASRRPPRSSLGKTFISHGPRPSVRGGIRLKPIEWVLFAVLVLAGVYLLVFHTDPFPANHEDIGLGQVHLLHDIVGIVLLGVAVFVWRRSRTAKAPGSA